MAETDIDMLNLGFLTRQHYISDSIAMLSLSGLASISRQERNGTHSLDNQQRSLVSHTIMWPVDYCVFDCRLLRFLYEI